VTLLVALALLGMGAGTTSASAAIAPITSSSSAGATAGGMSGEAEREYTTMVATRYQHHNRESEVDRTYFYDCVGFISYALGRATPAAWATTRDALKIRPGSVPSPTRYVSLFDEVDAGSSLPGWAAVTSVAALQPGDVVAWYYDRGAASKPGSASGHAVVVGAAPTPTGGDTYSVLVYDSTATAHGPDDTRLTNPANEPGPGGRPSGLGRGTIGLQVTSGGQIASVQLSAGGRDVRSAHYGMARPVS